MCSSFHLAIAVGASQQLTRASSPAAPAANPRLVACCCDERPTGHNEDVCFTLDAARSCPPEPSRIALSREELDRAAAKCAIASLPPTHTLSLSLSLRFPPSPPLPLSPFPSPPCLCPSFLFFTTIIIKRSTFSSFTIHYGKNIKILNFTIADS